MSNQLTTARALRARFDSMTADEFHEYMRDNVDRIGEIHPLIIGAIALHASRVYHSGDEPIDNLPDFERLMHQFITEF